jgi:hypothetical protein
MRRGGRPSPDPSPSSLPWASRGCAGGHRVEVMARAGIGYGAGISGCARLRPPPPPPSTTSTTTSPSRGSGGGGIAGGRGRGHGAWDPGPPHPPPSPIRHQHQSRRWKVNEAAALMAGSRNRGALMAGSVDCGSRISDRGCVGRAARAPVRRIGVDGGSASRGWRGAERRRVGRGNRQNKHLCTPTLHN